MIRFILAGVLVGLVIGCTVIKINDAPPCDSKSITVGEYVTYESCTKRKPDAQEVRQP